MSDNSKALIHNAKDNIKNSSDSSSAGSHNYKDAISHEDMKSGSEGGSADVTSKDEQPGSSSKLLSSPEFGKNLTEPLSGSVKEHLDSSGYGSEDLHGVDETMKAPQSDSVAIPVNKTLGEVNLLHGLEDNNSCPSTLQTTDMTETSVRDQTPSTFKKIKMTAAEISSPCLLNKELPSAACITVSSCDGKEFSVAASVLAEGSGYFQSCLRSGMKESLTKTVKFANLSSSVLEATLTFLRTSACTVSLSTVKELLFASTYLQIPALQDHCSAFLIGEINLDTCITIYNIAGSYGLVGVQLSLKTFLCESISEFSATTQFKDLSVDQLHDVLGSDKLKVISEREVLDVIVVWLRESKELVERFPEVPGRLLSVIRIPCLYMESHEEISALLTSVVKDNDSVTGFLNRLEYYQSHPELCHQLNTEHISQVRNDVEVIMTLGGLEQGIWKKQPSNKTKFAMTSPLPGSCHGCDDLTNPIEPFVLHDKHTSRLLTKVYEHCICQLDNYIYLAGGQTAEHERAQFATSAVYRFDPRVFEWTELSPMNTSRSLFYLGTVSGKLYAIGGASQVGVENTVECYDPSTNKWVYMKPMVTKLHEHAGCVMDDCIHISGGHDGVIGSRQNTWFYYPNTDTWLEKAPMINARANHAMVAVDKKLFVIGGTCLLNEDVLAECWDCESYDMASDEWTVITSSPRLTSCLSAVTVDKSILCFGGYTFTFSKYVDMVQVYNTENNTWELFKLHMNVPKCLLCEKVVVNELMLYAE